MADGNKEPILIDKVKESFADDILDTIVFKGEVSHIVKKSALRAICNFLKIDPELKMNYLVDVLGVDHNPPAPDSPRF